ncbi:MAG: Asp-tRNA(Asn)/Glu-tRNA(Gln) amidotransferase subunit GatB [Chitinophagia bacterium]|nr:Asp-tRNA(Asn)/Glu-tRNA(Gln) amidotransferase subunit GatB [Chitinophagia bacterium]
MQDVQKFEVVIGLEIHAQLATNSKLFCGDRNEFGGEPNTRISAISLAYPGTLPKTNKKAVELAVKLGLAIGCTIEQYNFFARKNYFYPDLPKGYQISQHTSPICKGGELMVETSTGKRSIKLNRIHLEEDAGKSLHDQHPTQTYIDLNRAGTPLVEIVTEPNIYSAEEAGQFVAEIRKLVRWLGVSDGNMEEGSLRCDANISLRPFGTETLGTKVEVKNLNSIRHVKKAIEFEIGRMTELLIKGKPIIQQTRSYDAEKDITFALRDKEEANDYRYFPDPDLAPFTLSDEYLQQIKKSIPELPNALFERLILLPGITAYDAHQLTDDIDTARFFDAVSAHSQHKKAIANWMTGPIRQWLNENQQNFATFPVSPARLAELIELVESAQMNFSTAVSKLLPALIKENDAPLLLAEKMNLLQNANETQLIAWVEEVLLTNPDKVTEYKKGKKGLLGLFVGEIKKISKGKADPQQVTRLLQEKLQ